MKINGHDISAEGFLPNCTESNGVALKEPEEQQIALATGWLRLFAKPLKRVSRTRGTSYTLKHHVEHWARSENVADPYVSNGAFIVAALRLGYAFRRDGYVFRPDGGRRYSSKNCYFNISVSSAGLRDMEG